MTASDVSSPPTGRALAVLELLVAEPEREFRLADIVTALGLHKSTCHAIVTTMVARGYLTRADGSRGYMLGPAVIVAGRAAELANPAVRQVRSVLPALARELDAECVASVLEPDVITVVEWASPRGDARSSTWSHLGQHIPLVAPFGAAQMAWADDQRVARWLSRSTFAHHDLLAALAVVRARGYDIQTGNANLDRFRAMLALVDLDQLSDSSRLAAGQLLSELGQIEYPPEVLEPRRMYDVNAFAAPVFDHDARPVLTISLHPSAPITGRAAMQLGRRLRAVADDVTSSIGGAQPPRAAAQSGRRNG